MVIRGISPGRTADPPFFGDMRYHGQSFEIEVRSKKLVQSGDIGKMATAFHDRTKESTDIVTGRPLSNLSTFGW